MAVGDNQPQKFLQEENILEIKQKIQCIFYQMYQKIQLYTLYTMYTMI